ncbi:MULTISPECIES: hypothetical protein [Rhodomicrobium]|uniref:AMP-binding enzyme n=1 Tax=Rhodomicrobium TaxID=1068 RepID=UPI0014828B01|nr:MULTISPECIES: hypothetical protein [Rhodomicrobium]
MASWASLTQAELRRGRRAGRCPGRVPVAFIRLAGGAQPEDFIAFCRAHLAPYKTLRHWRFIWQFPMTPSGKIEKFVLRARFMDDEAT